MKELLYVLAAVATIVGTAFGVYFGYDQWKKSNPTVAAVPEVRTDPHTTAMDTKEAGAGTKTDDGAEKVKDKKTPELKTDVTFDYDGNTYKTVQLGQQVWMAENLKTTHYQNGDAIEPKLCSPYGNDAKNTETYGRLYSWNVVVDNRNVCPAEWHVPNDGEWDELSAYLGGDGVSGGKLKSAELWSVEDNCTTELSGFSGLPGGYRSAGGAFSGIGYYGKWWSTDLQQEGFAKYRGSDFNGCWLTNLNNQVGSGFSVRCVKNRTN